MKVFRKEVRKIVIAGNLFYYLVIETDYKVTLRIYSGIYKSTFFQVSFNWKVTWDTIVNKPGVCCKITRYALLNGWNYAEKNQRMIIQDGDYLVTQLSLKETN
jgi:hypothetical protein